MNACMSLLFLLTHFQVSETKGNIDLTSVKKKSSVPPLRDAMFLDSRIPPDAQSLILQQIVSLHSHFCSVKTKTVW